LLLSRLNLFFWHSFVLAATDHLHQKIAKLEARMHSLEDAIAIVHNSNDTHPLLMSVGVEEEEEEESILKPVVEEAYTSTLVDALGTLHVDGQGSSRFFGPSGGSEVCLIHQQFVSRLLMCGIL
jgi:hypothetical protein